MLVNKFTFSVSAALFFVVTSAFAGTTSSKTTTTTSMQFTTTGICQLDGSCKLTGGVTVPPPGSPTPASWCSLPAGATVQTMHPGCIANVCINKVCTSVSKYNVPLNVEPCDIAGAACTGYVPLPTPSASPAK